MPSIPVGKNKPISEDEDPATRASQIEEARAIMARFPVFAEFIRCSSAVANGDFGVWKERTALMLARYGSFPLQAVVVKLLEEVVAVVAPMKDRIFTLRELMEEALPLYMSLYLWGLSSRPNFGLTSDFFEAIAVTDFGDPSDAPLYMPFDAFTLSFPPSQAFGGASRIFVSKIPHVEVAAGAEVPLKWDSYRATLLTPEPVYTQWRVGLSRKELFAEMAQKVDYADAYISEKEFSYAPRIRTLVSNVLSYIEAGGDLPTQVRGKKEAPQAVERIHPTRPLFEVGRVVKLDGNIRNALRESAGDKTKWALAQRFIVRGHWRNQAHGPARSLRRRQWIEPHWKGPEDVVAAFDRTYVVTT